MAKKETVYPGVKKTCDNCGELFEEGKIVIAILEQEKAFCTRGQTRTEQAMCAIIWSRKNGATDEHPFILKCFTYRGRFM